jgi:adenylate cyclase
VPKEIERKFLVADEGWRAFADTGRKLRQAYLAETERAAVRVRIEEGGKAFLTIKSAAPGLTREEFEYPIPSIDAEALFRLRQGSIVEKTRFRVPHAGRIWELDVYQDDNAGLVVAEVELASEADAVELPAWLGREVTGERRYFAARLSQSPFRDWPGSARNGDN